MVPSDALAPRGQGEIIVWLPAQVNAVKPMNNVNDVKTPGIESNGFFEAN